MSKFEDINKQKAEGFTTNVTVKATHAQQVNYEICGDPIHPGMGCVNKY